MSNRNFNLEAFDHRSADDADHFRVRVAWSSVGEQPISDAASVSLPRELSTRLKSLENSPYSLDELVAIGQLLADALFPPPIRDIYRQARATLDEGDILRVQLKLDTHVLAALPWEFLYLMDPASSPGRSHLDGFLALDSRTSLVRYEEQGEPVSTLEPFDEAMVRLLLLMADPTSPGLSPIHDFRSGEVARDVLPSPAPLEQSVGLDVPLGTLDLQAERHNIEAALNGLERVAIEALPGATIEMLQDSLMRRAHIFHFAGHGAFVSSNDAHGSRGEGFLVLVDSAGRAAPLSVDLLTLNLRDRGVRLVVLDTCQSGRRDERSAWTGIAPALARSGIPAVVAMQFSVRDANAIHFSRAFYRGLAAGESIDQAVREGRLAIVNASGPGDRDWGNPVLYLRLPPDSSGELFTLTPSPDLSRSQSGRSQPPPNLQASEGPCLEEEVDQVALREQITSAFSVGDLKLLCADVQQALSTKGLRTPVDLETVGGSTKPEIVLNLIVYLSHRRQLCTLVDAVSRLRPGSVAPN